MKIVLQDEYSDYLRTIKNISNVELWKEIDGVKFRLEINKEFYDLIFIDIEEYRLPYVILCNPKDGVAKKPHLLQLRKNELFALCLSIKEDISVRNKNFKDIINYTLKRVIKLITMNKEEEIKEFRKEFLYFWDKNATNEKRIQLYIKSSNKVKYLDLYKKNNMDMFVDRDITFNNIYINGYDKMKDDILYIPLVNSNKIMPPIDNEKWNVKVIKDIFNNSINEENIEIIEDIVINAKQLFLVFEMYVPGVVPITFCLKLKFNCEKNINLYNSLDNIISIECLKSERCDKEYLFRRIGVKNDGRNKKILIIGAGSLGSYVISELPKIGVDDITIVDSDEMRMENIMRHSLGTLYAGSSKVFGMKYNLETQYPEMKVEMKKEKFDTDTINKYNISNYQLVIVATGGTDYMLKLNNYFKVNKIKVPVLFTWIESRGIGVHALLVDYNKSGCFNCLYDVSDINKAHFNVKNHSDELTGTGCGGVVNKYGNIVLLKGSAMILEIILNILQSKLYSENLLFSVRTINEHTVRDGCISYGGEVISRTSYISEGCGICGSKV